MNGKEIQYGDRDSVLRGVRVEGAAMRTKARAMDIEECDLLSYLKGRIDQKAEDYQAVEAMLRANGLLA